MARRCQNRLVGLQRRMQEFSAEVRELRGVRGEAAREALALQIIDSLRRIEFVQQILQRPISADRGDPQRSYFDPIRAAALAARGGQISQAWWLVFLATHFGRHEVDGWKLCRTIYGAAGTKTWDWNAVLADPMGLPNWVQNNLHALRDKDIRGRFSNHRKYESISRTPGVLSAYIDWILSSDGPQGIIRAAHEEIGQEPSVVFDHLFKSAPLRQFGRLGRFDFFTMLAKLGVAPIEPGHPYLIGATGPQAGARLLFDGSTESNSSVSALSALSKRFGEYLEIPMQAVEDSLCNWQKSPSKYIQFRG